MTPSIGIFISINTYVGSIYDPSGNMFDFSSTTMGMGIQSVLNSAVQISYRGVMCGLINMTLTAVMGGSWEQAKSFL